MRVAGASRDAHSPPSQDLERQHCGLDEVAEFVREETQALSFRFGGLQFSLPSVLGNRLGGHVVEAAVQRVELVGRDFRFHLVGEFGDRLTDVAVVMHDLPDGEALLEKIAGVVDGVGAHLRRQSVALRLKPQRLGELIEENGDAVLQLVVRRQRYSPLQHLVACPTEE